MAQEGFKQLQRVFGNAIEEDADGEHYKILFPKTSPEAFSSGNSIFDSGEEGGLMERESNRPANIVAMRELKRLGIPANEIKHYNSAKHGIVEITKYGAEHPLFIEKIKQLKDGHFLSLTGSYPQSGTETEPESLSQQALAKLKALHEGTSWKITDNAAGEPIYTTTAPVKNAQAVVFHIVDTLDVPMESITLPPKGAGSPAIPVKLITQNNVDKLDNYRLSVALQGPLENTAIQR